eukprot:1868974-Amphidinium_carterae.1
MGLFLELTVKKSSSQQFQDVGTTGPQTLASTQVVRVSSRAWQSNESQASLAHIKQQPCKHSV